MFAGRTDLAELAALGHDDVVICATQRLARHLRLAQGEDCRARGLAVWRPLRASTVAQWLAASAGEALLAGAIAPDAAPRLVLAPAQELALWERVVAAGAGGAELFDLEGLAAAAQEANLLMETWGVRFAAGDGGEETRRFLQWRAEFRRRCAQGGWLEPARATAWQIEQVERGACRLPPRLVVAGFDRYTPQEERLLRALAGRGVMLLELSAASAGAAASVVSQADRRAECRAAAAWAAGRLAAKPGERLGLVVPELAAVREPLADALDAALHPEAFGLGAAEMPRRYNFSLGTPLANRPLVATALALLRLAANPRAVAQAEFGELLRGAYWSADVGEADVRARLEARMRERLAPTLALERILRFLRREGGAPRLLGHLEALGELAVQPARQRPSAWGGVLRRLLAAAGWPGERALSSHDYQAREALLETLDGLAALDAILGPVAAGEAVARLARLARERVFQPQTEGDPPLQVMGPLEAAGGRFDAIWVLGMNDDAWPQAARPNPLLPAQAQRQARAPASCAEVEGAFARAVHRRLLASAPIAVFSWARAEGDRQLRPSPLLAGLAMTEELPAPAAEEERGGIETLADPLGPPLAADEEIAGGAALLRAQALCPAWAFHRYRLGAQALPTPVEGLDAKARGILLHRALELFWRDRGLDELRALLADGLDAALAKAVDVALGEVDGRRDEPLPPRLLALERARLGELLREWLALEAGRSLPFRVAGREMDETADVGGLRIKLRVDRVDELPDGRRLILDYKSRRPQAPGWSDERIAEPQLPLYAAFAPTEGGMGGAGPIAGVAFAQVRRGEMAFSGESAEDGLLPGVDGRADWPQRLAEWRRRLAALAAEVMAGEAAVRFAKEGQLKYCEVKPLLRLPEARAFLAEAHGMGEGEDGDE